MQPIPETVEALRILSRSGDARLGQILEALSARVSALVPSLLGLSLTFMEEDMTFTLVATSEGVADLDALQYSQGGPCDTTLRTGEPNEYRSDDPADEATWQSFAMASASAGVGSTLSIPVLREREVVAGVNLYARDPDAFQGRHQEVADACGGWAEGVVRNADLAFSTRAAAVATSERIQAEERVDEATGVLMSRLDVSAEEAAGILRASAERAGLSEAEMADIILSGLPGGGEAPPQG